MDVNIHFGQFHSYIIFATSPYCQLTCFHYGSTLSIDLFLLVLLFIQNINNKNKIGLKNLTLNLSFYFFLTVLGRSTRLVPSCTWCTKAQVPLYALCICLVGVLRTVELKISI